MADRKPFLLRIDSGVLEALQHWANDDLRSLNAQIEFVLRQALRASRRVRRTGEAAGASKEPGADTEDRTKAPGGVS